MRQGFTLLELSIVLVIIGLIVGGVLTGQSLINAAAVRAQISQIERYQTAAATFQGKYSYLPGDIPDPAASRFGFLPRGSGTGQGNGNGFIEGYTGGVVAQSGSGGEAATFWVDLATAHLIDQTFNTANPTGWALYVWSSFGQYVPLAKISTSFVYVWTSGLSTDWHPSGSNFFAISGVGALTPGGVAGQASLTPGQAYAIDSKVDDGFPQSGNVTAVYLNFWCCSYDAVWVEGSGSNNQSAAASTDWPTWSPTTAPTAGSPTTCFDNRSGSGPQQYSTTTSNGNGVNCALSFKMQAGD